MGSYNCLTDIPPPPRFFVCLLVLTKPKPLVALTTCLAFLPSGFQHSAYIWRQIHVSYTSASSDLYGFIVAINSWALRPELAQQIPDSFLTDTFVNTFWAAFLISSGSNPGWMSPISSLNSVKVCMQRSTITAFPDGFRVARRLWKTLSMSGQ